MALIDRLLSLNHAVAKAAVSGCPLPSQTFFFGIDGVVCFPRDDGDSRYPYSHDGLTLWAYASGYLSVSESSFFLFPPVSDGKEPPIAFFGGVEKGSSYLQTSLTGVAKKDHLEGENRYCAFLPSSVIYHVENHHVDFYLRAFVDSKKQICLSLMAYNASAGKKKIYLSSLMNALMMHSSCENEETRWFKRCDKETYGYSFEGVEDLSRELHLHNYATVERALSKEAVVETTTSRAVFAGGKNETLSNSPALQSGHFSLEKDTTLFSDIAAAGDIIKTELAPRELFQVDYRITIDQEKPLVITQPFAFGEIEREEEEAIEHDLSVFMGPETLNLTFHDLKDSRLSEATLNQFIRLLQRQVHYGALAKNSSVSLLGTRDVAQMIEANLLFDQKASRAKILEVLSFEDPKGRFARQYSIPKQGENPLMDNREFIDQGQWVISLVRTYLAYSGDVSLLSEVTTYYDLLGRNSAHRSPLSETVYAHLERAIGYLLKNIDPKTGCLMTLYGDWNDAVDGLGVSSDPGKPFGDGVSAMATFHLYKNLLEMGEIAQAFGKDPFPYLEQAQVLRENAKRSLLIEKNGERRIIHGWGENQSFFVGSYADADGQDRVGVASNAFYVTSGLEKDDPSIKDSVLHAFHRLDSKYGLKTFEPFFDRNAARVGRIVNLPKGTAENGAVYIHAAMFGVKALFELNEPAWAYQELYKLLPITHRSISTSPFVMPNSYIDNPEIDVDGQSMSDWFTGSSNTLLKLLVSDLFGLVPNLDRTFRLAPASVFPSSFATLGITIQGVRANFSYHDKKEGSRTIVIDGVIQKLSCDENGLWGCHGVLPKDQRVLNIEITD